MSPQNVTDRYINNLLRNGKNDDYETHTVSRQIATVSNIPVGIYYSVTVTKPAADFKEFVGIGATPNEALRRALQQDGVTFR